MKFKQVMKEYIDTVPLDKWNYKQRILWLTLVKRGFVERQDVNKFNQFAQFFDSYYKENNKIPTIKMIMNELGLKEELLFTCGIPKTKHDPKRSKFASKDVSMKDYEDAIKGKKPYLPWIRNIRTKM